MAIKYRAVHTTQPWRKARHSTIWKAIDGPDGAKNLLRRKGRVGKKWDDYGPVSCVFVWDEDQEPGYAFRLQSGSTEQIETVEIPTHLLERHDQAGGCPASQIESYFRTPTNPQSTEETEQSGDRINGPLLTGEPAQQPEQSAQDFSFPEELPLDGGYAEGIAHTVLVNTYERSVSARNACIAFHGPVCRVCGFDFEVAYGEIGRGYIHVHHVVPLSSIGARYSVDPVSDLVPVCPNCHAMLHRREPPFTAEELRARLGSG